MTNEELVRIYVEGMGARDLDAVAGTLAEDFVYEHALIADGVASRIDGAMAFCEYLAGFITPGSGFFSEWEFYDVVVYPGHDGHAFAEWRSRATVAATGRPYANRYLGVFEVRDGRIALVREYRDPSRVEEAMAS